MSKGFLQIRKNANGLIQVKNTGIYIECVSCDSYISLLDSNSKHPYLLFRHTISTLSALNSDPQLHTRQTISHFLCLDVQQWHPLRFNKIQKTICTFIDKLARIVSVCECKSCFIPNCKLCVGGNRSFYYGSPLFPSISYVLSLSLYIASSPFCLTHCKSAQLISVHVQLPNNPQPLPPPVHLVFMFHD